MRCKGLTSNLLILGSPFDLLYQLLVRLDTVKEDIKSGGQLRVSNVCVRGVVVDERDRARVVGREYDVTSGDEVKAVTLSEI